MIKMMFVVHRRPGMEADEFHRYWRETHAPIAAKIPGLRKYVQYHASIDPNGADACDGMAEMWFEDEGSFATPEYRAAEADAVTLIDMERILAFRVDDKVDVV